MSEIEAGSSFELSALKTGDRDAWFAFCEHFRPIIMRDVRFRGLQECDAEDIAQETLVAVWKNLQTLDVEPKGAMRAWIQTVARNKVKDLLRGGVNVPVPTEHCDEYPDISALMQSTDILVQTRARIVLEKLQSQFEQSSVRAFVLTTLGRSTEEVARATEKTAAAVRQNNYRIKKFIRSEFPDIEEIYSGAIS